MDNKYSDVSGIIVLTKKSQILGQESDLPRLSARFGVHQNCIPLINASANPDNLRALAALSQPNTPLPELNILRVTFGSYGSQRKSGGDLIVGGMELELSELDQALIRNYPVKVHVLSRAVACDRMSESVSVSAGHEKASLRVDRIPGFGRYSLTTASEIRSILDSSKFDLIHLHQAHGNSPSRDVLFQEAVKRNIPVVISTHTWLRSGEAKSKLRLPKLSTLMPSFLRLTRREGLSKALYKAGHELWHRIKKPMSFVDKLDYALLHSSPIFTGSPLVGVSEYSNAVFGQRPAVIIGSAIDTDFFRKSEVKDQDKQLLFEKLKLPRDQRIIAYHARIEPGKGQICLVEVARKLKDQYGDDFHFVLAGHFQDKGYVAELRNSLNRLGLNSYFTLSPALEAADIRTLLSVSSALVFPTQYEALGRTGIEAMLMGVPVVAHNVGGIPGYIKHEKTGLLVERGDSSAMAECVARLLRDPGFAQGIVSRAEPFVRQRFSADDIARDYLELAYGPLVHKKSVDDFRSLLRASSPGKSGL